MSHEAMGRTPESSYSFVYYYLLTGLMLFVAVLTMT